MVWKEGVCIVAPDVLRIPPLAPIKEALTVFSNRQDRRDEVQSRPIAYVPHYSHGIINNHKQEGTGSLEGSSTSVMYIKYMLRN